MIRSIIYVLVSVLIIVTFTVFEITTVNGAFGELSKEVAVIKEKAENETLTGTDVYALQKKWLEKKEKLHVFIPHNEIKEVDLWLSECLYYARAEDYKEAYSKAEVLSELFEQIPKTFSFRIENIL